MNNELISNELTNDELITILRNLRLRLILRWLTTRNVDVLEWIECESVGVNLRDLVTFVTLSDELTTGYSDLLTLSILRLLELTELQRIERLRMFLQWCRALGGTADKHACDGPDFAQTKNLHQKTGDVVSELKISSDWRRNIYASEVHTDTLFLNSSGLTMLEKDRALLFRSRGSKGM